ncbi:esterase/lipase family protein [Gordonia sp. NPDC062954]|uniref:esterase/lipase family protein n=1 Tax=Gordonia sp. NPDC062954 TaxID=3364003 RepID=UPI0037C95071
MATIRHGDLVIEVPDDLSPDEVAVRDLPDDDPLAQALSAADDLALVHKVTITIDRPLIRTVEASTSGRPVAPLLRVRSVGDGDVLLCERGGCYSWATHRGTPPDDDHVSAVRPTVFDEPRRGEPELSIRLAAVGSAVPNTMQVFGIRLQRPMTGDVVAALESRIVRPSLVEIADSDPRTWMPIRPADVGFGSGTNRVVLLVHGTFSTTRTGFGWRETGWRAVLDDLIGAEDTTVLGFTHRTLSEDPEQNARQLVALLDQLRADRIDLDILTYSRGALVARSAIELVGLPVGVVVRDVTMLGGPNAGTLLADRSNWSTLLDLYTTLLADVIRRFAGAAGGAAAQRVLTLIFAVVKGIIDQALDAEQVPGLAAMTPGSAFLDRLNAGSAPDGGVTYSTVVTDFEPSEVADMPQQLSAALARIADEVVDPLMGDAANDLVVDVGSMSRVDGADLATTDIYRIPSSSGTHHLSYLLTDESLRVVAQLLD